jgi:hypothetical protein
MVSQFEVGTRLAKPAAIGHRKLLESGVFELACLEVGVCSDRQDGLRQLYPDAASPKQLGGLHGYSTERVAVDLDVNLDALSDSKLRAEQDATLAAIRYTVKKVQPPPAVIEAEAVEVAAADAEPAAAE